MTAVAPNGKSLFICVGDVSADRHAARVVRRLQELAPDLKIWGVGGPEMEKLGVDLLANCQRFATIGILEPVRLLPFFVDMRARILKELGDRQTGAALLVDFGGFNIGLAQLIRPRYPQLPVIYFISPQVWGSRPWRIQVLKRCITKMLTIFPFEESLYKKQGVDATFVGHPLCLTTPDTGRNAKADFCRAHGLDPDRPLVGIFPGSRRREIGLLLPQILDAVQWLAGEKPDLQFAISRANTVIAEATDSVLLSRAQSLQDKVKLLPVGENWSLMAAADILWTKSGTTTLEAALFHKPMLIFYRGDWLSYWIFLAFKRVKRIGWPNLLAGKMVVPELIQLDCRAEKLVKYTRDWLDVPGARAEISQELMQVKGRLGQGDFADNVAHSVLTILGYEADSVKSSELLPG